MDQPSHIPVLLLEILEALSHSQIKRGIDGTLGLGGHTRALLEAHPEIEEFYGLDKDPHALTLAQENLQAFKEKISFIHTGFEEIADHFKELSIDMILLDLGVSSMQLDLASRGFSFMKEGPLDMRMDTTASLDAKKIVQTYSERELERIFKEYGEERFARQVAKAIVNARKKTKFESTQELIQVIMPILSPHGGRGRIHPATRIFQALRIEVNDELNALKQGLEGAFALLKPRGKLLVISFHSLEDRIVKNVFRDLAIKKRALLLTKKPKQATLEEMRKNPRSRSAKLRVLEKM